MKPIITEIYTMEELLPVVADLTNKYTCYESSSVTYERAQQLMEAAIYCIAHFYGNNETTVAASTKVPASDAYNIGYQNVLCKVKALCEKYNNMILHFCHYGNENYCDTVQKALPGFFKYYDPKFAPTENIITMDYPVYGLDCDLCGVDMIEQYLDAIIKEQKYLGQFDKNFVIEKLRLFHPQYEKEFINIEEIFNAEYTNSF